MLVFMGLVSLVVSCQQKVDFPHYFIGCCWREAGYGPTNQSAGVLWIVSGALLLGVVDLFKFVDNCMKSCYMWTT
jgi:hypothetical protein